MIPSAKTIERRAIRDEAYGVMLRAMLPLCHTMTPDEWCDLMDKINSYASSCTRASFSAGIDSARQIHGI